MPVLPNLQADPADLIGQDNEPALRLRNTGAGSGLHAEGLVATSTASIDRAVFGGQIAAANATVGIQASFAHPSRASGAVWKFEGGLASASSILAITGGVAGTYAIRVALPNGQFGWVPVYPNGAVTLAAVE